MPGRFRECATTVDGLTDPQLVQASQLAHSLPSACWLPSAVGVYWLLLAYWLPLAYWLLLAYWLPLAAVTYLSASPSDLRWRSGWVSPA